MRWLNYAHLTRPGRPEPRFNASVANGALSSESWLEALRQGRTFATNGPLLDFSVAGNSHRARPCASKGGAERVLLARRACAPSCPLTTPRSSANRAASPRETRNSALIATRLEVSGHAGRSGAVGWLPAASGSPPGRNIRCSTTSSMRPRARCTFSVRGREAALSPERRAPISRRGIDHLLQTTGSLSRLETRRPEKGRCAAETLKDCPGRRV